MLAWFARVVQILLIVFNICVGIFGVTTSAAKPLDPNFVITVDSVSACRADSTISGTAALTGVGSGYVFSVQLRDDNVVIAAQTFDDPEGYPDGTYTWVVAGDLASSYHRTELYFAIYDTAHELVRQESRSILDLCPPESTPSAASRLPFVGIDWVLGGDRLRIIGFVVVILTVLAILTALERQKGR